MPELLERPRRLDARELALHLAAHRGKRPDRRSFDGLYEFMDWAWRCVHDQRRRGNWPGLEFERTICQIARGLGYELTGDRERDMAMASATVRRRGKLAQDLGLIRWEPTTREDGGYRGVRLTVLTPPPTPDPPDGVDITTKKSTTRRRGDCIEPVRQRPGTRRRQRSCDPPRRSPCSRPPVFFLGSAKSGASLKERVPYGPLGPRGHAKRLLRAGARGEPSIDDRSEGATADEGSATTAVASLASLGDREALAAALQAGVDPLAVALRAFELALGRPSLGFSARTWRPVLRRSLRRIDRYAEVGLGSPGLGLDVLCDLLEGHAELEADGWLAASLDYEPVKTLAYVIAELEGVSKRVRHHARHRLGGCGEGCRYVHNYIPRRRRRRERGGDQ